MRQHSDEACLEGHGENDDDGELGEPDASFRNRIVATILKGRVAPRHYVFRSKGLLLAPFPRALSSGSARGSFASLFGSVLRRIL